MRRARAALGRLGLARRLAILVAAAICCVAAAPAAVAGASCPNRPEPQIILVPTMPEPVFDEAREVDQLVSLGLYSAPDRNDHAQPFGLTESHILGDVRYQIRLAAQGGGDQRHVCASPENIEYSYGFSSITIHVARELAFDSCMQNVVIGHEFKHVAVDRALVAELGPALAGDLARNIAAFGVIKAASQNEAKAAIDAAMASAMRVAMRRFTEAFAERQAEVDSRQEYLRVQSACSLDRLTISNAGWRG